MVVMPAGSFTMGSPASEWEREDDEGPRHQVTISNSFAVGKFEITRGQYASFITGTGYDSDNGCWVRVGSEWKPNAARNWANPDFQQTDQHPVTCVNWDDAQAFIDWVNKKTGRAYRLLTEAEWEYSARAGTSTPFSFGQDITTHQANFNGSSTTTDEEPGLYREGTTEVGLFPANAFGLHDMHGNLWEWTQDCWNDSYEGAPTDGTAWAEGDCARHVLRGGSWTNLPQAVRSADRVKHSGDPANRGSVDGFRVARDLN
jgi:formylglycine-generating enzyme required for sulfatase activity